MHEQHTNVHTYKIQPNHVHLLQAFQKNFCTERWHASLEGSFPPLLWALGLIPSVPELTGSPWSSTIALIPTSGWSCRQPLCAADTCLLMTRPSHRNTHSRPCSLPFPQPVSFHTHLFPLSICVGVCESFSLRYLPLSLTHSVNQWSL